MRTDYSDWVITIPLLGEKDLFPSFSDGCNASESVAKFNSMFLLEVEKNFPEAWVDQGRRFDVIPPGDATDAEESAVREELIETGKRVRDGSEWMVPS